MNAQEQALFNAGVKGELRTANRVPETITDDKLEDMATLYIAEFLKVEKHATFDYWGVVDALVFFRDWLPSAPQIEFNLVTPVSLTVTLTLPTADGKGSIAFALNAIPTADMPASLIDTFDLLVASVNEFRKRRSTGSGAPPSYARSDTQSNGGSAAPSSETIDIVMVKHENKSGKHYYRLAGGRWLKFGVPCWPEVWEQAGMDPSQYPNGDTPVKFKAEVALASDGKPQRVTRILPA
jgi:hypothetical protein